MTVDQAVNARVARSETNSGDMLLDGLFTGMIGAIAVALWFLILDVVAGRPLYTPALLGSILMHGNSAANQVVAIAPLEIAAYTGVHFLAFTVLGIALSWSMTLFERYPIMFFVLLVMFLCLQIGFFGINAALHMALFGRLQPWTVVVANLLASVGMFSYQLRRHPNAMRGVERLWQDDTD